MTKGSTADVDLLDAFFNVDIFLYDLRKLLISDIAHLTTQNKTKFPSPFKKKNLPPQFAFKLLVSNISAPALFIYFLFPPPPSQKKAGIIESKLF